MKKLDLIELQTEYKSFLEQLYSAHDSLSFLVKYTNEYLTEYIKLHNYDKEFAEKVELNLLYFEKFYEVIDYVTELTESTNFNKLKIPEIKNLINIFDHFPLPDKYDIDIVVDMNRKL